MRTFCMLFKKKSVRASSTEAFDFLQHKRHLTASPANMRVLVFPPSLRYKRPKWARAHQSSTEASRQHVDDAAVGAAV